MFSTLNCGESGRETPGSPDLRDMEKMFGRVAGGYKPRNLRSERDTSELSEQQSFDQIMILAESEFKKIINAIYMDIEEEERSKEKLEEQYYIDAEGYYKMHKDVLRTMHGMLAFGDLMRECRNPKTDQHPQCLDVTSSSQNQSPKLIDVMTKFYDFKASYEKFFIKVDTINSAQRKPYSHFSIPSGPLGLKLKIPTVFRIGIQPSVENPVTRGRERTRQAGSPQLSRERRRKRLRDSGSASLPNLRQRRKRKKCKCRCTCPAGRRSLPLIRETEEEEKERLMEAEEMTRIANNKTLTGESEEKKENAKGEKQHDNKEEDKFEEKKKDERRIAAEKNKKDIESEEERDIQEIDDPKKEENKTMEDKAVAMEIKKEKRKKKRKGKKKTENGINGQEKDLDKPLVQEAKTEIVPVKTPEEKKNKKDHAKIRGKESKKDSKRNSGENKKEVADDRKDIKGEDIYQDDRTSAENIKVKCLNKTAEKKERIRAMVRERMQNMLKDRNAEEEEEIETARQRTVDYVRYVQETRELGFSDVMEDGSEYLVDTTDNYVAFDDEGRVEYGDKETEVVFQYTEGNTVWENLETKKKRRFKWRAALKQVFCCCFPSLSRKRHSSIHSVAEKPIAQKPVAQKPVAPKPVAQNPVAQKPVAKKPVAKKPVAQKPVAQKPLAKKPVAKKPVAKKTAAQKPVEQEPRPAVFM